MNDWEAASTWLGLERISDDEWRLQVTDGVMSGARALFGGCATTAAIAVARSLATQPVVFAANHFGALAPVGASVTVRGRVVAAGRTMTHLEVEGTFDGKQSFLARVSAGSRPSKAAEGQWVSHRPAGGPEDAAPFDHPVHEGTWAGRFEWRLAGVHSDPPACSWWVRPRDRIDSLSSASMLVDYVTYGVGRALGIPMGGLSIDNVVRVHQPAEADWYLLEVAPEAAVGGIGFGSARLYANESLVAAGTQSIVVADWDWRLPGES